MAAAMNTNTPLTPKWLNRNPIIRLVKIALNRLHEGMPSCTCRRIPEEGIGEDRAPAESVRRESEGERADKQSDEGRRHERRQAAHPEERGRPAGEHPAAHHPVRCSPSRRGRRIRTRRPARASAATSRDSAWPGAGRAARESARLVPPDRHRRPPLSVLASVSSRLVTRAGPACLRARSRPETVSGGRRACSGSCRGIRTFPPEARPAPHRPARRH